MNKLDNNEHLTLFLSKFYDICATTDCYNLTLDEFYSQFPVEMHEFLLEYIKNEVKRA